MIGLPGSLPVNRMCPLIVPRPVVCAPAARWPSVIMLTPSTHPATDRKILFISRPCYGVLVAAACFDGGYQYLRWQFSHAVSILPPASNRPSTLFASIALKAGTAAS